MNEPAISKDLLIRTSSFLKKDIQYILDKKKTTKDAAVIEQLDTEKKEKIEKLEQCTKELKEAVQRERDLKQQKKEIDMATRAVDTIEYTAAKRKKNVDAKKVLEERAKARTAFQKYQNYEEQYNIVDPKEVPAFLFLHDSILQQYGLCPYLKMDIDAVDFDVTVTSERLKTQRTVWLQNTPDNGKTYFDLYERVVSQTLVRSTIESVDAKQACIEEFLGTVLSPSQRVLYASAVRFMEEYSSCAIKTKKIKERFKDFIHKASILCCESQIPIQLYLGERFGMDILVNEVSTPRMTATPIETEQHRRTFMEHYEAFKSLREQRQQQERFISNTVRYTKNELYLFLTGQKQFVGGLVHNPAHAPQQGKYFKKWSELTEEEKLERFASFAAYYDRDGMSCAQLTTVLQDAFKTKSLGYRDFKWNMQKGVIQHVKGLSRDDATGEYKLDVKPPEVKDVKLRKSVSKKSVLDADGSEEILNDEILLFILENLENSEPDVVPLHETLKARLNVKRLTANDVQKVNAKLKAMEQVVKCSVQKRE